MRRLIATVTLGLVTACLLVLPAAAGENCDTFQNHSGHIPGSYDYAEFFEDGQLVTTVETFGEDVFVNPDGWDADETWDTVNKCHYSETTTTVEQPPSVTVECLVLTVDAAEGQIVGVQIGDGFVEIEGSDSFVGEAGQSWAVYYNDQVLANGVFEECDITTTTTPATTTTTTQSSTTTTTEATTTTTTQASTTTTAPPATTTSTFPASTATVPSDNTTTPELPLTGPAGVVGLLVAGLAALGIGTVLVREFASE